MWHLLDEVPDEYRSPLLWRVRDRVFEPPLLFWDREQLLARVLEPRWLWAHRWMSPELRGPYVWSRKLYREKKRLRTFFGRKAW